MRKYCCLFLALFLSGSLLDAKPAPDIFINNWLVLGLFDNDAQNSGFQRAWIDEAAVKPREGQEAAGKKWQYFDDRLFSRNYDDYQDLWSYYKNKRGEAVAGKVVYAHTYIFSPKPVTALFQSGADSEARIWVNGSLVLEVAPGQPYKDDLESEGWRKITARKEVSLNEGWNSVLVKVANTEDTRLGFYLGISTPKGERLDDLTVSVNGPGGPLSICTGAMRGLSETTMPGAWREWPYVGARPDPALIYPPGSASTESGWLLHDFMRKNTDSPTSKGRFPGGSNLLHAGDFFLQAQGGTPPYQWSISDGGLPPGLALSPEGRITGEVASYADLKAYPFTARVKDAEGAVAHKELGIEVRERPNKKFEEARLVALIHLPEFLEDSQIEELAKIMKAQGYQIGMPISYNNGEFEFRWPSPYAPAGTRDTIGKFKAALERNGIGFGMYFGNLNYEDHPKIRYPDKWQHHVMEEAIRKYKPTALWLDWPTRDGEALDSLYSMIRVIDPELTIVLNGHTNATNGDWDIVSFEAWGAWGERTWSIFPVPVPWPKKHSPETWRLMTDPQGPANADLLPNGPYTNVPSDWKEYLRLQLALIGEGFIADVDHSATLNKVMVKDFDALPLVQSHRAMGAWASPAGKPPLYPSYTQVNPGPLNDASWGYDLINVARDTIYLHLLKNPRGKTGLPEEKSITVGPVEGKVKAVTWMNENRPLAFEQRRTSTDQTITIDLAGVKPDEIDTIFKIELEEPLSLPKPEVKAPIPAGNLASFKPSLLLGSKGTEELIPSSGNFAKYGNDGNLDTVAVAGGEYAWTYQVDLGRVYSLKEVAVLFGRGFATKYQVLLSDDGKDWVKVAEASGASKTRQELEFAPTEARYVRIVALTPNGPNQPGIQMGIAELEVYE